MLRNLSKTFSRLTKFSTYIPFQNQPIHLHLLYKKITNKSANQKLQLLNQLCQSNTLQQYFHSKTIQDFSIQDIYFYITHRQKFRKPYKQIHIRMITNLSLDCYSFFVFAHQMQLNFDQQFQNKLVISFNQGCMSLGKLQLLYCFNIMYKFNKNVLQEYLNIDVIRLRIKERQQQFGILYLELLYLVKQICPINKIINFQTSKLYLQKIREQIVQQQSNIKYFYLLQILQPIFNIKITKQQQKIREALIQNKIQTAKTDQQLQFSIKILKNYHQFTFLIKIQRLNAGLYIQYIKYCYEKTKQNPNFCITYHDIPALAIQTCKQNQFLTIIQLRVQLQLNKEMELGRQVKKVMKNLQAVYGMLKFINRNYVYQSKVWSDFQDMFISKLYVHNKNRDIFKIFRQYNIISIWKILAYINVHKLGSLKFWKIFHHLVYDVIMQQSIVAKILYADQNKFVLYTYQIYQFRTIPTTIQPKLIKLTLFTLANNKWDLWQLQSLCKTLAVSRYGKNQIWYALENKIMMFNISKDINGQNLLRWIKIYQSFQQMNIGTYKFYLKMKKYNLDEFAQIQHEKKMKRNTPKKLNQLGN